MIYLVVKMSVSLSNFVCHTHPLSMEIAVSSDMVPIFAGLYDLTCLHVITIEGAKFTF